MENEINSIRDKLISAKEASKITGYSTDYIGQLARAGKINGRRVGKSWSIDRESVVRYIYVIGVFKLSYC